LEENIVKASQLGIKKVIGDLILDPINMPGILESLSAYRCFSIRHPHVPLMFGVGNVTELIDADTVGVNAVLAGIASELGVSVLLTTEGSDKTKGSINELVTASKMMFLAKKRNSVPKDLGLDLLILKDKRLRDEAYDKKSEEGAAIVIAREIVEEDCDPKGEFKISIDRKEKLLVATRFIADSCKEIIKGRNAKEVYLTIIHMNLVSTLSHAAYLGRELEKAETALNINKTYIQDEPLFS
jgi:dihydropteroate synthase-like protein